jgi:AcrR family transcriptional regulator
MSSGEFQRARRPDQKEERRRHLLQVTRSLLSEHPDVRAFGLNELARQSGMTKSNVYRYFESRESLLLELLQEEWSLWYAELRRAFGPKDQPATLEQVAEIFSHRTASHPLLAHLTSVLPSIIEHNLSVERIREFKRASLELLHELAAFMHARSPYLSILAFEEFVHLAIMMTTGIWPFSHPSTTALEAIQTSDLAPFRYEFERDLARGLLLLLRGLSQEQPDHTHEA